SWTYQYSITNQLIEVKHYDATSTLDLTAVYSYDLFGNRNKKIVTDGGGTTTTGFAYDGWNPANPSVVGNENFNVIAQVNGAGSLTTKYIYGDVIDQILARIDGAIPRWYLTDHLGSVRDVIDSGGLSK